MQNEVSTLDKYEYKVRSEEIRTLVAEGEYAEAVKIADTIDWRRVRSVMMLCMISDLYKINRRYQESKDILLLAYEKHPTGRLIVYSLCELSIKLGEYVQAMAYYNEFSQIAPKDTGRYILLYRLYEAQDVSLEERIAVLEEFKKRDYREKWAYELAYLYHRIGLTTKCVEECDEMFLWFGEGRYVVKALELKALHEPLSADQQTKYDMWIQERDGEEVEPEQDSDVIAAGTETEELALYDENTGKVSDQTQVAGDIHHTFAKEEEKPLSIEDMPTTELPEIRTVDVGQYNTINLQAELADHVMEVLGGEDQAEEEPVETEPVAAPLFQDTDEMQEIKVNPIPFPARAEEIQEEPIVAPVEAEEVQEEPIVAPVEAEEVQEEPVAAPVEAEEAREEPVVAPVEAEEIQEEPVVAPVEAEEVQEEPIPEPVKIQPAQTGTVPEPAPEPVAAEPVQQEVLTPLNASPSPYDNILSQEYDGQISLVVPDAERIEKQITGQLSIDDIMAEWEQMKKTNAQKRMEDVSRHVWGRTQDLFEKFDEETKNDLLAHLEKAFVDAIRKEAGKSGIKEVILPDDIDVKEEKPAQNEEEISAQPQDPISEDDTVEELEEIEETTAEEISEPEQQPEEQISEQEETPKEEPVPEEEKETPVPEAKETKPKKKSQKHSEKKVPKEPVAEKEPEETEAPQNAQERELTEEEKEIFGKFVHHRKSRQQLVHALDNMSLASCTGNILVTGEEEDSILALAKGLIREMQMNDGNFSGKVAKISGSSLNKKNVEETFARLDNGALIIEKAAGLNKETAGKIAKTLEKDNKGLLLLMTDKKQKIDSLIAKNAALQNNFNLRIDVEALDDESLVEYAKLYAQEQEYSIDDFGVLALHTRIDENQTSDHEVTLADVRELVDEAIYYANKKTPGHFMDVLFGKRYDKEDMIVLREKDFMHY